ncbi:DNA-3-methyladenine glycosylase II OS=Streptomyces rimosus subsp. rimosus (strain ATCC / DSM 40260 / JCM 4667 / NRRL 2234) OX=1265868 GN=SRIM_033355 PE=4 SV=1 [Streptomyces rimosus subsp. rimosus]
MHTDFERCLRAVRSKDARFDGWFYTAVRTTRIYCRPSCPVVPPKPENMTFYPSAAAAQQAGYRACKRCRPDASPGSPQWDERADCVARAMRLIADGVVDREGVPGLAARLGYSTRQVERQLLAELGAGPLALARAQRAQTARLLIETTELPMADVAFAAGFASIRTFNDTVREVFALAPTELRRRARPGTGAAALPGTLALRLPFRQPLCRTTSSDTWPRPPCRAWRSGGTARTGARSPSRTDTASSPSPRAPTTSNAGSP